MENSLISVIVPVYNTEKYLTECVESIISQTYRNLEIILVDDGSTDLSGSICNSFAEKDSRIIVIHQKNVGLSAARNRGLDECHGEFVAFVDSDDIIPPDAMTNLMKIHSETAADLVIGGYYGIGTAGYVRWNIIPGGVKTYTGTGFLTDPAAQNGIPVILVWGKLYSKELWDGIRFPIGQRFEDSWIMPEILHKAKSVATCPQAVYRYYERESSIVHSENDNKKMTERLNLFRHLTDFYGSNGYKNNRLKSMSNYLNHFLIFTKEHGFTPDKSQKALFSSYFKKAIFSLPSKALPLRARLSLIYRTIKAL